MSLPEENSKHQESGDNLAVQDGDEDGDVWPPWPWPPWGGDGHDHDGDDDKPGNWTQKARKLARAAVKFERRLAEASLDL